MKRLIVALFIVVFCFALSWINVVPVPDGSDAISYYHEVAHDFPYKHPLNAIYMPLVPVLSSDQLITLMYAVPPILFNLAILFFTGNVPLIVVSLLGGLMFNSASSQMLSVALFLIAFEWRHKPQGLFFGALSILAHRFGAAYALVYGIAAYMQKYDFRKLIVYSWIPLILVWVGVAFYFTHVNISFNEVVNQSIDYSLHAASNIPVPGKHQLFSDSNIAKITNEAILWQLSFFCFFEFCFMNYANKEHLYFCFLVMLLAGPCLLVYYAFAGFQVMQLNFYNDLFRVFIFGLVPIGLFFLAVEKRKHYNGLEFACLFVVYCVLMALLRLGVVHAPIVANISLMLTLFYGIYKVGYIVKTGQFNGCPAP